MAASLLVASYQDIRERSVTDIVWIGGGAGIALVIILTHESFLIIGKVALIGLITLVFAKFGSIGQADAIAFVIIAADPYPLSPIPALLATSAIAGTHIAYLFAKRYAGSEMQITLEQFKKEQRWIPKSIVRDGVKTEVDRDVNKSREEVLGEARVGDLVQVTYGVPTVAYLGVGYSLFLAYLLIFDPGTFLSLP